VLESRAEAKARPTRMSLPIDERFRSVGAVIEIADADPSQDQPLVEVESTEHESELEGVIKNAFISRACPFLQSGFFRRHFAPCCRGEHRRVRE